MIDTLGSAALCAGTAVAGTAILVGKITADEGSEIVREEGERRAIHPSVHVTVG